MEMRIWESEPREWNKRVNAAQPAGLPLPIWGPHPVLPTLGSQLPRFSSRREKREGERQGCAPVCCCPRSPLRAPSLPDRKPAPIPSQLQLATPPPPPPQAHRVTLPWAASPALQLRPGSSALAPKDRAYPGAAPAQAPPPGPRASPLILPR